MMRKENGQKRITSMSFTQIGPQEAQTKKNYRKQIRSQQQKRKNDDQKSMQQKASLNNMLSSLICQTNQKNQSKGKSFKWELILIDEKRTMAGIKVRLKCRNEVSGIYVVVRISFTLDYFRLARVSDGNIFVELDQINFQIAKKEKRMFQAELEQIIKPSLNKNVYVQDDEDKRWVKQLFYGVESILAEKNFDKRNKKNIESINRKQNLTNYILYHPPVCFAWSPKGNFCLTQNKVPVNKNSFICTPNSFKLNIEIPIVSHMNTVNQDELTQNQQQDEQSSIFYWDVRQELHFLSFRKQNKEVASFYKDNKSHAKTRTYTTSTSSIRPDTMFLQHSSKLSPTLRKIYERYFIKPQLLEVQRGDKLNVYSVLSDVKKYQDQMIYLMEKINLEKHRNVIQSVFEHTFSGYNGLLYLSNIVDKQRYFIISEFLKQQKASLNGAFSVSWGLKAMILENQHFSQQIESYLKKCLKILLLKSSSYFHFDQCKAENILMMLLEQYFKFKSDDDCNQQVQLQLSSSRLHGVRKMIKIKKIVKLPSFSIDWILTEQNRKRLLQIVLPILMVRGRNFNDFQYRQIARIITANSKIVDFYKSVKQVNKKLQQGKHDFLEHLLYEYSLYQQSKKLSEFSTDVRRSFTIYCQKCQRGTQTFEIEEADRLRICHKCSIQSNR